MTDPLHDRPTAA